MPPVACAWQRARDTLCALQEELNLKRTQMERLSAEGRSILSGLDPMRFRCIAYVRELLVRAPPLAEGCRSSLYAALHSALAPESAAALLLRPHARSPRTCTESPATFTCTSLRLRQGDISG